MNARAPADDDIVPLGYIAGVHGVRGWVRVHSWTRPIEAILDYQPWLLGAERVRVRVRDGQRHGKTVIAALPDVTDRDQAQRLVRSEIAVRRRQLPAPGEQSWYWADLEGLEVRNLEGTRLGRVARMLETGAHDVMVTEGDRERLIPFVVDRYVKRVDLAAGVIEVDWNPED